MGIRQSVCVPLLMQKDADPSAFCREVAGIGYQGLDLWGAEPLEKLSEPAQRHGLTITSFVGHANRPDGLNDPAAHERIEGELRASIDLAVRHRAPNLIAFSGNRRAGQSDIDGMVACAHGLRRIAPYAQEKGVTICLELLNSKVNHFNYLADRSDWGFALCEMVNSPAVKILFDIYHMQIMEGDVIRNLRRGMKWIGHIHTAGNPGRNDLDDTQELNYAGISRAIADSGYQGFVGHEFTAKDDKLAALRQAFAVCNV
ncbi:MAG: TIM barrel protein [Phycisphaeraceae bacterium]